MPDKLDDVWTTRDYPVLLEVARRIDESGDIVRATAIEQALGLTETQVQQALKALTRRGLIDTRSVDNGMVIWASEIRGEAYLITGLHPSGDDAVSALVDALRQAADLTDDPTEKSRLRALADGALGISRNVLGGVLTAYLTSQIPGAGG